MAKTIKFNLILDNYPVRNIESMQEHFSMEDMLKYFESGLLLRWLNVRGYEKEYEKVFAIDKNADKKTIITELVKIFEVVDLDDSEIEKAIGILSYLDEDKELNAIYRENAFCKKQVIDDYHSGYMALIMHMQENKDNLAVLKADAIQMEREYFWLFELDNFRLYFYLLAYAPKALFAMLTRDAFRKFWISEEGNKAIYEDVKDNLLIPDKAKQILGDDLKIVKRNTQAMWDPIERPEVKLMVIHIESGAFIKNAGNFSEKLGSTDVNDKLVKFDGLEYQCNDEYDELLYMEV